MRFKNKLIAIAGAVLIPFSYLFSQTSPFVSFDVQPGAGCSIVIQWEVFAGMDTLKFDVEKARINGIG